MPQFTITPHTVTIPGESFTANVDIRIDSIENTHALEFNFDIGSVISAGATLNIAEGFGSTTYTPEVIVNYTEI